MRIKAKDIEQWVQRRDAQGELPLLVRRLAMQVGTITQIAFPSGESISRPGWDGEILSKEGDPWVPAGRSCWEVSAEDNPASKANRDYKKRTEKTFAEIRREATFVALTARYWRNKDKWIEQKQAEGVWQNVRACDADDLEAWLEASPAIALAFAEEIGLEGDGVESISRHWQTWVGQCQPPILPKPFLSDRDQAKERLLTGLRERIERDDKGTYAIRADSAAEAAAFVCAALLEAPELIDDALVVTSERGWRFVETNPRLKLAVVARSEIAEHPAKNVLTVVPIAAGDLASGYGGKAGHGFDLALERASIYAFRDALIEMGIEESDARRLARATGRSWSVYRRRHASNPAIRSPEWLKLPEADALAMLCLLGAWHSGKDADRAIVERLAGESHETVERKLRTLSQVDDTPVIAIGKVWRAKAPLELLDLCADRITADELQRFLEIVESLLVQPDPRLDLDADQRWMAQVYGKVRAESGLLFESVCDTLVKLAVRGPDYPGLAAHNVEYRIAHLVERLLGDANGERWLSLASRLRLLAEAAPDAFLRSIEASLGRGDAPVERLFTESVSSDTSITGGFWWYTDLLWALEILAWHPRWMPRVASILARLSHIQLPGNWSNRPFNSLLDIFRAWWPRTAANLQQRIAVLDSLTDTEPDTTFNLMDRLLHRGPDMASPSAEPTWRDDDAGMGGKASGEDYYGMLVAAADRLIAMADGNAARLAVVFDKIEILDPDRTQRILLMVTAFAEQGTEDLDRERLRDALRNKLHWHLNYGKEEQEGTVGGKQLARWRELYEALSPSDAVMRHRWLFQNGWVDLPIAREEEYSRDDRRREDWRKDALREIYQEFGLAGVERLAESCGDAFIVRRCLLEVFSDHDAQADWIIELDPDFSVNTPLAAMVSGILRFLPEEQTTPTLCRIVQAGEERGWAPERIAAFFRLARDERLTWNLVQEHGDAVESAYWRIVSPGIWRASADDREYVVTKLLAADRPITALNVVIEQLDGVSPALLERALDDAPRKGEPDAKLPGSWHLAKLIERLEAWEGMDQKRLLQIEFQLVPAFEVDQTATLKALTEAVTSRPDLFAELVCLIFRAEKDEPLEESAAEGKRIAAESAWRLLHDFRRQPGTLPTGEIDAAACIRFVDEALALCRESDRLTMGEQTIGQILAHAPEGKDGIWPGHPARDILNRPECVQMRKGFEVGTRNKRGMTTRSMDEGGDQERTLAASFRRHADALSTTHPFLSASLEHTARSYEADARGEDDEAALRRERY